MSSPGLGFRQLTPPLKGMLLTGTVSACEGPEQAAAPWRAVQSQGGPPSQCMLSPAGLGSVPSTAHRWALPRSCQPSSRAAGAGNSAPGSKHTRRRQRGASWSQHSGRRGPPWSWQKRTPAPTDDESSVCGREGGEQTADAHPCISAHTAQALG